MLLRVFLGCVLIAAGVTASAQPEATAPNSREAAQLEANVETLIGGLSRPSAVVVRPGSGRSASNLYLADSGTGRILTLPVADPSPEPSEVVRGLAPGAARCMVFRSRNALMVGLTGGGVEPAQLCEYDVETDDLPLTAGAAKTVLDFRSEGGDSSFAGIAKNSESLFVTTGASNLVLRSKLRGPKPGELKTFLNDSNKAVSGLATGVAFSPKGYLVVAQNGTSEGGSRIVFYHPFNASAEPALSVDVALAGIAALTYSPAGDLYVLQSSGTNAEQSGIYRIDSHRDTNTGKLGCKPTFIAQIANPTSLAFVGEKAAYVTSHGEGASDGNLLRVTLK